MRRAHAVLLALLVVSSVTATSIRRLSLNEIRDRSEAIVVGEVIGTSTRLGDAKMVWTDYQIRVTETLRGEQQVTRTLSFAGGVYGDRSAAIEGVPRLQVGRSYVFFLDKANDYAVPTLGWGQGICRVDEMTVNGKKTPLLVSVDGEPLELDQEGHLLRGRRLDVSGEHAAEAKIVSDESHRATMTGLISADGTVTAAPARKVAPAVVPARGTFLSLVQLREFVDGRIGEAPGRLVR